MHMSNGRKALLLAILLVAGGLRWNGAIWEDFVKPDEAVYVSAAEHWSAGRSPYEEPIFFYTPLFAWYSAEATERLGSIGYLQVQRLANLAGICLATWLSVLLAGWRWWPALTVSLAWVLLSPIVALPIQIGNATGLATALTLGSLYLWSRRPTGAGVSLGLAQALKPIAT